MRYACLMVILISASLFGQASETGWVLYDDFSQGNRPNNAVGDTNGLLWQITSGNCAVYGCNPNQVLTAPGGYLRDSISSSLNTSTGYPGWYYRNEPSGTADTYNPPNTVKYFMMSGYNWPNLPSGWTDSFTDMRFKFRCSVDVPSHPSQGYVQTLGTYVKNPSNTTDQNGTHYY